MHDDGMRNELEMPLLNLNKNFADNQFNISSETNASKISSIKKIDNLFSSSPSRPILIPRAIFLEEDKEISYTTAFTRLILSALPTILALASVFLNDTINLIFAGRYFSAS